MVCCRESATAELWRVRRRDTGDRCSGHWNGLRARFLAQNVEEVVLVLTEARIRPKWRIESTTARSGGESRAALEEEAAAGVGFGEGEVDGAPDSNAKPRRRLAEAERRDHGGAELRARQRLRRQN